MKYILYVLGIALFSVSTFYTLVSAKSEKQTVPSEVPLPYVVEMIAPQGESFTTSGVSASRTPFLVAKDLGLPVIEKDLFQAFPDLAMRMGSRITVYQTPSYIINDGKKRIESRSWAGTVRELLAENKLELGADDKINFSQDTVISSGMIITIIRVARTTITEPEAINFKTKKIDDPTLDKGKTKVKQAGKKGEKKLTYEVIREDGVQISKTLKKTEVVKEPVEEILMVGTKPVITVQCKFNDSVIDAAAKNDLDPNALCTRMMKESRGNPNSDGGDYKGLFQYETGFWESVSAKAGYKGASIWDAKAQINVTAWAWAHGYRSRWPGN